MTQSTSNFYGKRWHDMGGDPAGSIDHSQHDFALWEKRVDALMVLSSAAGLMNTDSLRRVLEDMGSEAYETLTYYERWMASVSQNMIEVGAFTPEELAAKMEQVTARGPTYGDAT
ncbi:MAG: ScnB-like protein [Planktomarina sp.]